MMSFNMLNGLFDPIMNFFNALLYYFNVIIYYIIVGGIGKICDMCQILFRKFAGLEGMSLEGKEGDIVIQFIQNSVVQQVFWAMVVLAVVLIFITSFVAVIKTEFDKNGNNNKKKVLSNALRGVVNFLIVPVVSIFGVIVGNALLKTLDGALSSSGEQTYISRQMFVAGAYNANRVRGYENTAETNSGYPEKSMADYIAKGYGSFGIFEDDTTGIVKKSMADKIDDAFASNLTINFTKNNVTEDQRTLIYAYANGQNDYLYTYLNYFPLGVYPDAGLANGKNSDGFRQWVASGDSITFSIYNIGLVNYYYNMSFGSFDYIIATIGLIFCAYVFLTTCLGLIKRLFLLVTLFIISPPICAMYPLDDGSALGKWRKEFIAQALSAYSVIVILNIFLLLVPLFLQIQVIPQTELHFGFITVGLINYFARVLIIIGALTFFKDATKTIGDMIGAGNAYGDGVAKSKDFNTNVRRVMAGAGMAYGMPKSLIEGIKGRFSDGNSGKTDNKDNSMNKDQEVTQNDAQNNAIKEQQDADNNGGTGGNGGATPPSSTGDGNNGLNKEPTKEETTQTQQNPVEPEVKEELKKRADGKKARKIAGKIAGWGIGAILSTPVTAVIGAGVLAKKGLKALGKTKFGRFTGVRFKTIGNVIGTTFKNIGKLSGDKFRVGDIAKSYNDVVPQRSEKEQKQQQENKKKAMQNSINKYQNKIKKLNEEIEALNKQNAAEQETLDTMNSYDSEEDKLRVSDGCRDRMAQNNKKIKQKEKEIVTLKAKIIEAQQNK